MKIQYFRILIFPTFEIEKISIEESFFIRFDEKHSKI